MFEQSPLLAFGTSQTTCGVFQGTSLPRTGDLHSINLGFDLHGERYSIREFEDRDVSTINKIAKRIEEREGFQQFYLLKEENPGEKVLELARLSRAQEVRPDAKLAVVSPDNTVVGYLAIDLLPTYDGDGNIVFGDIGYFVDPLESGKGVMTTAVRTALDIGFQELGLPYINVTVNPTNEPSVRLLERMGAAKVGTPYWVEKYQAERQAYVIHPENFYGVSDT
jgi:RimJ/RimL family protein N-acetyltransferase